MPATKTCGNCQAEVAFDAMFGLCRNCLFDYAARPMEAEPPSTGSGFGEAGRRFADYELGQQIGRGGMGVVYEAVHVSLHRTVALKMILDSQVSSSTARLRFTLEAETAAKLDHPNIVPIYEIGEHQGQPFLSMKLIVGENLRKKIASGDLCLAPKGNGTSRTDLRERAVSIVRLVATIAQAVHHAHQSNVLHRDLKPANIVVDRQGQPHLTDFGLAKIMGSTAEVTPLPLSGSGAGLGTPSYMSPEQAAGQGLTPASDVYSLGVILYEMLTGLPPFKAGTLIELLRLVAEQEPKAPSLRNQRVDKDLDTICLKSLEKNPAARYPTAEALAEDLEHWLKGEPIRARRVGLVPRTLRWGRRNPLGASLIASLCICLAVTLALLQVQRDREADAARRFEWATEELGQKIDNAWKNEDVLKVTVDSSDLAALVRGPFPQTNAMELSFALTIPDLPVEVATKYARFLGELGKRMSREMGQPISFDLQLYKVRSYESINGARKDADVQGMTYLTYVRMKEADPNVQPLVEERAPMPGAILFARAGTGISNLKEVVGHRIAFAHTNSIISFLAKVELARAGLCANQFRIYTNLNAPRLQLPKTAQPNDGSETYAHRDVMHKVLQGEFEVGVAPAKRFATKKHEGPGLVELHQFASTPEVYVARAGLDPQVVRALRKSLLAIKDTTMLGAAKPGMREGFVAVTDADFDSFRKLVANEWTFFETCRTNK